MNEQNHEPITWYCQKRGGGACFYDSEVLNPNFVHLKKFSTENRRLRKPASRWITSMNKTFQKARFVSEQ
jgi:hypothetical protein